jgi:hypothetical protein
LFIGLLAALGTNSVLAPRALAWVEPYAIIVILILYGLPGWLARIVLFSRTSDRRLLITLGIVGGAWSILALPTGALLYRINLPWLGDQLGAERLLWAGSMAWAFAPLAGVPLLSSLALAFGHARPGPPLWPPIPAARRFCESVATSAGLNAWIANGWFFLCALLWSSGQPNDLFRAFWPDAPGVTLVTWSLITTMASTVVVFAVIAGLQSLAMPVPRASKMGLWILNTCLATATLAIFAGPDWAEQTMPAFAPYNQALQDWLYVAAFAGPAVVGIPINWLALRRFWSGLLGYWASGLLGFALATMGAAFWYAFVTRTLGEGQLASALYALPATFALFLGMFAPIALSGLGVRKRETR